MILATFSFGFFFSLKSGYAVSIKTIENSKRRSLNSWFIFKDLIFAVPIFFYFLYFSLGIG